jgi:hypothetical protein
VLKSEFFAPLAQLDRASGYEPGGRTFESCRARHPPPLVPRAAAWRRTIRLQAGEVNGRTRSAYAAARADRRQIYFEVLAALAPFVFFARSRAQRLRAASAILFRVSSETARAAAALVRRLRAVGRPARAGDGR